MLSRYAVPLLCAAALVFACGPRPHAAESTPAAATRAESPGRQPTKAEIAEAPLVSSLRVEVPENGGDVRFTILVTNRSEKGVELQFPSGLTHDFAVLDAMGREVWRWSEGRMYTQALQSKLLDGGETTSYEETWSPGQRAGTYTVVATLRSASHPQEQRATFSLR